MTLPNDMTLRLIMNIHNDVIIKTNTRVGKNEYHVSCY